MTKCGECGRSICDGCFEFTVAGRPACGACGYEVATRAQRRVSLAVAFVGLGLSVSFWLYRSENAREELGGWLWFGVAVVLAGGALILAFWDRGKTHAERRDRDQPVEEERALPIAAHPYRARARTLALRLSPRLSGAWTAAAVGAALAVSAVVLPMAFKLPRWVEIEVVLGTWWAVLFVTLSVLLHRGFRLRDDFVFVPFWRRPSGKGGKGSLPDLGLGFDGCSGVDGEGCLVALAAIVICGLLFGLAWVVAELALPIVLFATYALLLRALTRVAHDRHGCEGNARKAAAWGALWATVYVVPLSVIVWGVHVATR